MVLAIRCTSPPARKKSGRGRNTKRRGDFRPMVRPAAENRGRRNHRAERPRLRHRRPEGNFERRSGRERRSSRFNCRGRRLKPNGTAIHKINSLSAPSDEGEQRQRLWTGEASKLLTAKTQRRRAAKFLTRIAPAVLAPARQANCREFKCAESATAISPGLPRRNRMKAGYPWKSPHKNSSPSPRQTRRGPG